MLTGTILPNTNTMKKIYWLCGCFILLTFSACDNDDDEDMAPTQTQKPAPSPSPSPSQPPGYNNNQ